MLTTMIAKDALVLRKQLWKLYHTEEEIEENVRQINVQAKAVTQLRKEQAVRDGGLKEARETQAAARSAVMSCEKKVKKAEKSLDKKVFLPRSILFDCMVISCGSIETGSHCDRSKDSSLYEKDREGRRCQDQSSKRRNKAGGGFASKKERS